MQSYQQGLISPWVAGTSCVLFAALFVGSLYMFPVVSRSSKMAQSSSNNPSPSSVPSPRLDRDHPLVIQQRIKGIAATMVIVPIYLWILFSISGAIPSDMPLGSRISVFVHLLGLAPPFGLELLNHLLVPLALVAMLFMGPLLIMWVDNELPFQLRWRWSTQWRELWQWIGIRNYIVGPIAEEFIFRACMVSTLACSGASLKAMVFGLPLVFGIAHVHHGYESYVKKGRTRQALIQSGIIALVQLTYTSLFGWFATFLYLRTSNLLAPCLTHSFCNMMGLPDVSMVQHYGPWKKWIYAAFVLGMILFGTLLGPMTDPRLYGDAASLIYWPITVGAGMT
ncbi:hypothetical protein B0O80DRAFT_8661 [Mortierella sp. GBAus27b]|nr:hypothetical protein B0O80DRAFT_8661 [Mortierella sp. GBAus27b]